jgi:hypothetical protein
MARTPVMQVTTSRDVADFTRRFLRWSVMRRRVTRLPTYVAEMVLNPITLAVAALLIAPGMTTLAALAAVTAAKLSIDAVCARAMRGAWLPWRALALIPVKDLMIAWIWARGLVAPGVTWRGKHLLVLEGTRLALAAAPFRPRLARSSK